MKKGSIVGILAGLATAAGLYYVVSQRPSSETSAARFLPADTVALLEFPDVSGSRARWQETALHAISQEPEVKAFLEPALGAVQSHAEWKARLDEFWKTKPGGLFLASTKIRQNGADLVAGLNFQGDRAAVEALLEEIKEGIREVNPTATSDMTKRGEVAVETITTPKGTFAAAFREDWLFMATSLELLEQTLAHAAGEDADSLVKDERFSKSMAEIPDRREALLYARPAVIVERLAGVFGAAGMAGQEQQLAQLRKVEAIAASTTFEGRNIRDTMFTLMADTGDAPPLGAELMRFTSPETLLYYAASISVPGAAAKMPELPMDLFGLSRFFRAFETNLAARGVAVEDFKKGFGPNAAAVMDWPAESSQPTVTLAMDVRDREIAQKFVEAVVDPALTGFEPAIVDAGDVRFYVFPSLPYATPAVGIGDRFVAASMDANRLMDAWKGPDGTGLGGTPAFQSAVKSLPQPASAMGYLDAKGAFERIYGLARPMMILMAAFSGETGGVDLNKLPPSEAISKHLGPVAFTQAQRPGGILVGSVGPVTFNQAVILGVGTAAWTAAPMIKAQLQGGLGELLQQAQVPPVVTPQPVAEPSPTEAGAEERVEPVDP